MAYNDNLIAGENLQLTAATTYTFKLQNVPLSTFTLNVGDGDFDCSLQVKHPEAHDDTYETVETFTSTALAPLGSRCWKIDRRSRVRVVVSRFDAAPTNFVAFATLEPAVVVPGYDPDVARG